MIATLPRLGSRVRIPSPAPNFLKEINSLERSFGAVFRFPRPGRETGEAWGKHQKAQSGVLSITFGMVGTVVACSSVRTTVCDGATPEPHRKRRLRRTPAYFPGSQRGSPSASPLTSSAHYAECEAISSLSAPAAMRNRLGRKRVGVSAQTHAPRRSPRHLVQRVDRDHRGPDPGWRCRKTRSVH